MLKVAFTRLHDDAKMPTRKYDLDAGVDIYALRNVTIPARSQKVIDTGLGLAYCPEGHAIFVWPKSGLDAEFALHTGAGVIDSEYRGEILILLKNMSDDTIQIEAGDAIAQLVLARCPGYEIELADVKESSERGGDGGIARSKNSEYKTATITTEARFEE